MCLEFMKRMDPELPFYSHTSAHPRFYEGEISSFSEIPKKPSPASPPSDEEESLKNKWTYPQGSKLQYLCHERTEEGDLECVIEQVDEVREKIDHTVTHFHHR